MYNNNQQITWLDYILLNNPDGIRNVLAGYGYSTNGLGYNQAKQAAFDVMDRHGEKGIISLLQAHPEYSAFKDLFSHYNNSFFNTTDDPDPGLIRKMRSTVKPFDDIFIALSVFTLAYYIITEVKR